MSDTNILKSKVNYDSSITLDEYIKAEKERSIYLRDMDLDAPFHFYGEPLKRPSRLTNRDYFYACYLIYVKGHDMHEAFDQVIYDVDTSFYIAQEEEERKILEEIQKKHDSFLQVSKIPKQTIVRLIKVQYDFDNCKLSEKYNLYSFKPEDRYIQASKTTIKLYLALCSLGGLEPENKDNEGKRIGNNAIINKLNINILIKSFGCTRATFLKAMKKLKKHNIIDFSTVEYERNLFNFKIMDYYTCFLPAKSGGMGYFEITKQDLENLLCCQKVKNVRMELAKYVTDFDDSDSSKNNRNKILLFLPKHQRNNSFFRKNDSVTKEMLINLEQEKEKNPNIHNINDCKLDSFYKRNNFEVWNLFNVEKNLLANFLDESDKNNILQLAKRYSINLICHVIKQIKFDYHFKLGYFQQYGIKNIFALIQSYCINIYKKACSLT